MESHKADAAKLVLDGISIVTVLGALAEILPPIASLLTIIWMAIRIYETDTVQMILGKPPKKKDDSP
jgi:hypothetical protein